jgi:pimeloyl-[acyl-carrier protein] methyl ester esterase
MKLLFLHGWGFDASLWDGVRAALPDHDALNWDRGYFGATSADPVTEPVLAVGHSMGAMLLAGMPGIAGLVAVNGFDRFVGEDAVPPRVVDRMRTRYAEAPREVLGDFRRRIGAGAAPDHIEVQTLAADLDLLASSDFSRHWEERGDEAIHRRNGCSSGLLRSASNDEGKRMLVLQGGADPLLPEAMRESVFAGAPRETLAGAGHLLPLTHPLWVADRIRAFVA